jgi:methanogenic corrinoid protein MtbC1
VSNEASPAVDVLLPAHSEAPHGQPKAAIAVLDDHHVLGKRIVYSMLRASGWDLLDLGRAEAAELGGKVRELDVRILLISVLLLRSALKVREVRSLLDQAGPPVRVVVGGAPFLFDDQLWRAVGADDTGRNASEAVAAVARMAKAAGEDAR